MVNAVVKLPTFWSSSPDIWFCQTEAQFAIHKITEDATKYYHVVASLEQDTASLVMDILKAPPAQAKYAALKHRLLSIFALDDYERASRLLHLKGLGEDKPSTILAKMNALLGSADVKILFRQIFLEQMPENIRSHLVRAEEDDLATLVEEADKIWYATSQPSSASSINNIEHSASINNIVKQEVNSNAKPRKTQSSTKKPTVMEEDTTSSLCYYHQRFGDKATKCRAPCSKNPGNETAGRHL